MRDLSLIYDINLFFIFLIATMIITVLKIIVLGLSKKSIPENLFKFNYPLKLSFLPHLAALQLAFLFHAAFSVFSIIRAMFSPFVFGIVIALFIAGIIAYIYLTRSQKTEKQQGSIFLGYIYIAVIFTIVIFL